MVADFSRKKKSDFFNKNLLAKTMGVVFLIVSVFLIFSDVRIYQKKKELSSQVAYYQKRIEEIKKSSQALKDEIANSSNKDYLEKLAYEQLGEQKPGEKEIIFITPMQTPKPAAEVKSFWDIKSWPNRLSEAWQWIKSKF